MLYTSELQPLSRKNKAALVIKFWADHCQSYKDKQEKQASSSDNDLQVEFQDLYLDNNLDLEHEKNVTMQLNSNNCDHLSTYKTNLLDNSNQSTGSPDRQFR